CKEAFSETASNSSVLSVERQPWVLFPKATTKVTPCIDNESTPRKYCTFGVEVGVIRVESTIMPHEKLTGDELRAARENIQKDEKPVEDAIENVAALRLLVKEVGAPKPKK